MNRLFAVAAVAVLSAMPSIAQPMAPAPGQLGGQVVVPVVGGESQPLSNVDVMMRDLAGRTLVARTDASGQFQLNGVSPGVYAITARGQGVFACSGLYVVPQQSASANRGLPRKITITAAEVDYSTVKSLVLRYSTAQRSPFTNAVISPAAIQAVDRVFAGTQRQVMLANGGLKGRVHLAGAEVRKCNIFLIKDGDVVEQTISSEDGSFSFDNVEPGVVSFLALGESGMAVAGFELVDAASSSLPNGSAAIVNDRGETFVLQTGDAGFELELAPLPQALVAVDDQGEQEQDQQQPPQEQYFELADGTIVDANGNPVSGIDGAPGSGGAPGAGGTAAAGGAPISGGGGIGGGTGGGGGGIGGGLGGLASLAGLAAVAATSDDDNNNLAPPPPASPAR